MTSELFEGWTYTGEGLLIRPNGKVAPSTISGSVPYKKVKVNSKTYLQHRIVFFLHNGYWPKEVDHIDRNKSNNAPDNLRDVSRSENMHNIDVPKNNTSGIKGISFDTRCKLPWYVRYTKDGVVKRKYFATKEEAIAQRKAWEDVCE